MKDWKEIEKEIISRNFVECEAKDGTVIIDGKWYALKWGCDTIQELLEEFKKELAKKQYFLPNKTMKNWKEFDEEFDEDWQQYKDGTVDAICEPEEILKYIKQLQIKHIDEKIELLQEWEDTEKHKTVYDYDFFVDKTIKDLQSQKSILEKNGT